MSNFHKHDEEGKFLLLLPHPLSLPQTESLLLYSHPTSLQREILRNIILELPST